MATRLQDLLDDEAEPNCLLSRESSSSSGGSAAGGLEDEAGEDKSEMAAMAMLAGLDEDEKAVVNQFRLVDWLKVVGGIKSNPSLSCLDVLRQVGESWLVKLKEASVSQYGTATFAAVDLESEGVDAGVGDKASLLKVANLATLAKCTPLRLTWAERELMRLLESTLYISDYTDSIDIFHAGEKKKQIVKQIRQICSILTGLIVARDYEEGQRLIKDRDFARLAPFFGACFEIGRRYKVLNPERMRESYGKLMYFLMDSQRSQIMQLLEFDCVSPMKTVHELLKRKKNGLEMLQDKLLVVATQELYTEGLPQLQADFLKERKEAATRELIAKYSSDGRYEAKRSKKGGILQQLKYSLWSHVYYGDEDADGTEDARLGVPREKEWNDEELTEEDVETAIYSLKDHMTFLRYNERPIDVMYSYLTSFFDPHSADDGFSLDIQVGRNGARLSHGHARQYQYVKQSLLLWRAIFKNFFKLWFSADRDLLSSSSTYHIRDTGQGLHRIQPAPTTHRLIVDIIQAVQQEAGSWMGSSVVHLGDHNVPNALIFIDKYTQVPRIMSPIVMVINQIDTLCRSSAGIATMVNQDYGSPERLKKFILCDFFKHAFDGSGADNFFDAGSCIDGRLTSAWNWCSKIDKKPFYPIFLLSGFVGFDGKF